MLDLHAGLQQHWFARQGGGVRRERLAFCNLQMEFRKPLSLELKSYMEEKTISC